MVNSSSDLVNARFVLVLAYQNTAGSNGDGPEKLAQFLIVPNSKLNVARNNSALLVITGRITSKLQNLSKLNMISVNKAPTPTIHLVF